MWRDGKHCQAFSRGHSGVPPMFYGDDDLQRCFDAHKDLWELGPSWFDESEDLRELNCGMSAIRGSRRQKKRCDFIAARSPGLTFCRLKVTVKMKTKHRTLTRASTARPRPPIRQRHLPRRSPWPPAKDRQMVSLWSFQTARQNKHLGRLWLRRPCSTCGMDSFVSPQLETLC